MSDFTVLKPGENLSRCVADLMTSTQPGSFGPVLRGLLVAITASESRDGYLAGLIEDATVYAERNNL